MRPLGFRNLRGWAFGALYTLASCALANTHYVSASSTNPVSPYTNWATAATILQDAISAATTGDTVLVTNGVYDAGGAVASGILTNRIAITNAVNVQSVNGPGSTFIVGAQGSDGPGDNAVRCAYVGTGAQLIGFTLTNGNARSTTDYVSDQIDGGGAYCATNAVISNCVITGCSPGYYGHGGGVCGGVVRSSIIAGNRTPQFGGAGAYNSVLDRCNVFDNQTGFIGSGGGAYGCTVSHSTFSNNWASIGGAAYGCSIANSVIASNTSDQLGVLRSCDVRNSLIVRNVTRVWAGAAHGCTLSNCTVAFNAVQDPWMNAAGGVQDCSLVNCILYSNTTAGVLSNYYGGTYDHSLLAGDPQFANAAGDNYHLLLSSPCVDAGMNQPWMSDATDLDGMPRVLGGTVDIGCYEQARDPTLAAPSMSLPLDVPAGQTGVYPTTNTSSWIEGSKAAGVLVVARQEAGGYATNGIVQEMGGSVWSNEVQWIWTGPLDSKLFEYRCVTNAEASSTGASGTTLRVTLAGSGSPRVFLESPGHVSFAAMILRGTNNPHVFGLMWASNAANGQVEWFTAPVYPLDQWSSAPFALEPTNVFYVCGTNVYGDLACDSVVVVPQPLCDTLSWSSEVFSVCGGIPTNTVYQWQACGDLLGSEWMDFGNVRTAGVPLVSISETNAAITQRFYRIIQILP